MAKQNLDELPSFKTDRIVNDVNVVINERFGISGGYCDMTLMELKQTRMVHTDDEYDGQVEECYKWVSANYPYAQSYSALAEIIQKNVRYGEMKKLSNAGLQDLIDIEKLCDRHINDLIGLLDIKQEQSDALKIIDMVEPLKNEVKDAKKQVLDVLSEVDELHEMIKDKRKIVIKDTEPTKHRIRKMELEE